MGSTYAFADIQASIVGPGGSFSIGSGAGAAEEGISVAMVDDRSSMVIGADGTGQHNLHAGKGGTVTVRLLKTSPVNRQLQQMYDYQTSSAAFHGKNTITIRDVARGDVITASEAAFKKMPDNSYGKDGGVMEWVWEAIRVDQILGDGNPQAL